MQKSDATGDVEKGFEEDDKTPLSNRQEQRRIQFFQR